MLHGSLMRCMGIAGVLLPSLALGQIDDPIPGPIPPGPSVGLQTIATGLSSPVYLTPPGDGTGRLFVVDQIGLIRVIEGGSLLPDPFLDLQTQLVPLRAGFDERGLLGLAFHPGFSDPASPGYRKLYTFHSERPGTVSADFTVPLPPGTSFDHQNVVTEWRVSESNPNLVDVGSRREILREDHPQFNHNSGSIIFGNDGYLYIGTGDGGRGDDQGPGHAPQGNAQFPGNHLGKMLRIDPLAPGATPTSTDPVSANGQYRVPADNPFGANGGGLPEIYAFGFRNPYRFSLDEPTGRILVGDAGQNDIEEVSILERGGNFGWRLKEGTFSFNPNGDDPGFVDADIPGLPSNLIDPVLQYDHDEGVVVIGGFVYRGSLLPDLVGKYIFGDFDGTGDAIMGRLFVGDLETGEIHELLIDGLAGLPIFLKGFGKDETGEIYLVGSTVSGPFSDTGVVLKLVPEPATLLLMGLGGLALLRRRR